MDDESKKHADAMLDFWTSGKAMWSPKYDPRNKHSKDADADKAPADMKKEEKAKSPR